ncbi:MAG TPA: TIGR00730 family Rossman fold protein, partial [Thermoanaerobaculia bacterium]|nr:TIGR00730 family Rossman fold protein [Thermoanaerobaculia bacterium]
MTNPGPRSICVFCASSRGRDERLLAAAHDFGRLLASRGQRLVYGGGRVGLMGALADGALAGGGEVVGVIPEAMVGRELAHSGVPDLRIVGSMHERKATMAELADAFVALPGGIGTLEELFEIWTWGQLGLHRKPSGLLDLDGYYAQLLAFLGHAEASGFIGADTMRLLVVERDPERLL